MNEENKLKPRIVTQLTILSKMYEEVIKSKNLNFMQRKLIESQLKSNNNLIEELENS